MKIYSFKRFIIAILVLGAVSSCEDFLERPAEDTYTIDSFYQNDEQLYQSVNTIYNSPWYDFQRGFMKIGDVMAGNLVFDIGDGYTNLVLNNSDADIANASASLWSVNAYCNGVIQNVDLKSGPQVSQAAKNTVKGEAMVWKAMTYFYLVRCFGAVPIIHDNAAIIADNSSATLKRNKIEDVYKYITLILHDAIELLPEENMKGRIDKYSAYGLLAKVYLTKSGYGMSGTRNEADLAEAAKYAKMVIDNSGRTLHPEYSEIFQLKGNFSEESLIAWHWTVGAQWTSQNSLQSDLSLTNFSDAVQSWGNWVYPTIDLQTAFEESATTLSRNYRDARRKATIMMVGDTYDYFWTDMGGFAYNWDSATDGMYGGAISFVSGTGSNVTKHIVGRLADAQAQGYETLDRMHTPLSTHILRLSDVYLVYAEAVLGNNATTTDASALAAFNAVRARALKGNHVDETSLTFDMIDHERRVEFALEGDRWYDLVRLHYYNPAAAKAQILAQERGTWEGLEDFYTNGDDSNLEITTHKVTGLSDEDFTIPFPEVDLSLNPGLMDEPVDFDFGSIGYN
ncbi:RagB/SusD family nutrient uptake outer membrane protein [Carboxylicivirga sediminis]|uniref:RagB/SusD family nutrient uptake outer membrane protein n=1 Tax=Carboxylicivirga sediminis TaxID=2006564 RepID=A0A941EZM4_9BACT|nr:RagB/SusD family nutrient uptake outer membrane protein [Carboxylicivirga sediminis]MBR8534062.1 RagB/SusD family nutrient uptake outer membrane protein [Carboxylicivirga sediminis]